MSAYRTADVPIRGGVLRAGIWESPDVAGGAPVRHGVLALHGITASHLAWAIVAASLVAEAGVRVVAPDLRGRGRSNHLPGPWGMGQHAEDATAALEVLGMDTVSVAGHSMGGFAAMAFADNFPERVSAIVLVDGGLPLPIPPGATAEESLSATLGPAVARLRMTFASPQEYRDFWRRHPAMAADWTPVVAAYVDYDLVGEPPHLHSACAVQAVAADSAELVAADSLAAEWSNLAHDVSFLRAPRGLLGTAPGLYAPEALAQWERRVPRFSWHDVDDVNHYTITLGEAGARAVADEIRSTFG